MATYPEKIDFLKKYAYKGGWPDEGTNGSHLASRNDQLLLEIDSQTMFDSGLMWVMFFTPGFAEALFGTEHASLYAEQVRQIARDEDRIDFILQQILVVEAENIAKPLNLTAIQHTINTLFPNLRLGLRIVNILRKSGLSSSPNSNYLDPKVEIILNNSETAADFLKGLVDHNFNMITQFAGSSFLQLKAAISQLRQEKIDLLSLFDPVELSRD